MLNRLTIRQRLTLAFTCVLILFSAALALATWSMRQAASDTDYVLREKLKNERLLMEWRSIIATNVPRTVAAGKTEDPGTEQAFQAEIAAASTRASAILAQLDGRIQDTRARALLAEASEVRKGYQEARRQAFALKTQGDAAGARRFFDGPYRERATAYLAAVDRVVERQQALIDEIGNSLHASAATALVWTVALGAAAAVLSVIFANLISRSIRRQLGGEPGDAVEVASQIAAGNLAVTVPVADGDGASLLHAMRTMRDSLRAIVHDVRAGTDTITSSAAQIASGNQELSGRTEQQAGALEETASSMEQLTSAVAQTAAHSRDADALARSCAAVAQRGGAAVQSVVVTMGDINASARKIVDIIAVIDGIAFQTNILALNAAVEAARAGEQGRGFAVVASEVRTLAQRSGNAAKEIKDLIANSVEKVQAGTELVDTAGRTMAEVVDSIEQVSQLIGDIARASAEQKGGIDEMNGAVGDMDGMTQQNAALVEESAAAAHSMQEQAQRLAAVVRRFVLDSDAPAAGRRPVRRALAHQAA